MKPLYAHHGTGRTTGRLQSADLSIADAFARRRGARLHGFLVRTSLDH
jgi:hypothetical protein